METHTTDNKAAPAKKSRGGWWVVGIAAVVTAALVVAGGAIAAGFLSSPGREGRGESGFEQRPNFQLEAAKELPTTSPALRGIVTKRDGNNLTVGQRGGPGSNSNTSAQLIDVAIGSDTTIYHDVTQMDFGGQPPSGPIQQKVEPGSLDGINTNGRVTVWGDQNGNQIAAKVLVYSDLPAFRPQD